MKRRSWREEKPAKTKKESSRPIAAVVPESQTGKAQVDTDLALSSSDTDAEPARTVEPHPTRTGKNGATSNPTTTR